LKNPKATSSTLSEVNAEDSQTQFDNPCDDGWPFGYALLKVFPFHPAVLPFQGVGTEWHGLKVGKSEVYFFQEIVQE